jgi:copper transport protein
VKARRLVCAVGATLAGMAALAVPLTASAHALPQSAIPAEGSEVQTAPKIVEITFGETPDPKLSTITVVNGSGVSVDAGPTIAVPGHPLELEVPLKAIGNGVYTVTWKTVSEVDGHLATGAYAFGVGESAATANAHAGKSVVSPPPSVLAIVGRWLFFIGVMGIAGIASTCLVALRDLPRFAVRMLGGAWVLGALGVAGIVEAQREAAGVSVGELFSTSLGTTAIERIIAIAVTGIAILVASVGPAAAARVFVAVAGLGAAAEMWVDVAASHAGAQAPVALNLIAQWAHIAAAGIWIGGLLTLLLAVRGQPSEVTGRAVRRFSTIAGVAIVVVALTGTFRAVIEVGSIGKLFSTAFGVLVLVKVALFLILAGLGAINRFGNVPRSSSVLRGLRRVGSTEVVIGVAVTLVAAALVNVAPPVASTAVAATAQATQVVVTGSDFATTVRVRLVVSPGTAGFNTFTLHVAGYDTGAPVNASSVELEFTNPLRPQLGESTLSLKRQSAGTFAARGANVSISGIWEVAAIIENASSSTEVHLQLTTGGPQPYVTETPFQGLPTLYSIQLQNGWLAQVYLDPDKPGADEFHVTFFTNANETSEVQIASVTIGMTPPGDSPTILVPTRLDPIGHFVAPATVPAGPTRFDILATTQTGVAIATYVTITPGSAG